MAFCIGSFSSSWPKPHAPLPKMGRGECVLARSWCYIGCFLYRLVWWFWKFGAFGEVIVVEHCVRFGG